MKTEIIWERLDEPGLEHCSLSLSPEALLAEGQVVTSIGGLFRLTYSVLCDLDWRFREAELRLIREGEDRSLSLRHEDAAWIVDGVERPDLAGCVDIDIMATPFSNSLPIRRVPFEPDETQTFRMAYVALPDFTVRPDEQAYTRLDTAVPPRRFRYHGLGSGFVALLDLDEAGLVTAYEGLWRRRL